MGEEAVLQIYKLNHFLLVQHKQYMQFHQFMKVIPRLPSNSTPTKCCTNHTFKWNLTFNNVPITNSSMKVIFATFCLPRPSILSHHHHLKFKDPENLIHKANTIYKWHLPTFSPNKEQESDANNIEDLERTPERIYTYQKWILK